MSVRLKPGDRCERCGDELEVIEVWRMGHRDPLYRPGRPCTCPGPRCPCCEARLSEDRCPTLDCPIFGVLVPDPVIA